MNGLAATATLPLILRLLRAQLGQSGASIVEGTTLFDLSAFDSLAIVTFITAVEKELGIEFPASAIVPTTFETPTTIAEELERHAGA